MVSQTTPAPTINLLPETPNLPSNTTTQVVTITTSLQQPTTIAADNQSHLEFANPQILDLKFYKNYFIQNPKIPRCAISNCPMQEVFPTIAKDPNYGIKQPVPKITGISAGEYNTFLREWTEGKNENTKMIGISACEGAAVDPCWNFIAVTAKISPRNARPANYSISMDLKSQGKTIAQSKTTDMLIQDQTITLTSYIPLKSNEMDLFDSVEMSFTQLQD